MSATCNAPAGSIAAQQRKARPETPAGPLRPAARGARRSLVCLNQRLVLPCRTCAPRCAARNRAKVEVGSEVGCRLLILLLVAYATGFDVVAIAVTAAVQVRPGRACAFGVLSFCAHAAATCLAGSVCPGLACAVLNPSRQSPAGCRWMLNLVPDCGPLCACRQVGLPAIQKSRMLVTRPLAVPGAAAAAETDSAP